MRKYFNANITYSSNNNLELTVLTKADDIRDFEIEGMSIGDSLLDHYNKNELNDALEIYEYPGGNDFIYYFLKQKIFRHMNTSKFM